MSEPKEGGSLVTLEVTEGSLWAEAWCSAMVNRIAVYDFSFMCAVGIMNIDTPSGRPQVCLFPGLNRVCACGVCARYYCYYYGGSGRVYLRPRDRVRSHADGSWRIEAGPPIPAPVDP